MPVLVLETRKIHVWGVGARSSVSCKTVSGGQRILAGRPKDLCWNGLRTSAGSQSVCPKGPKDLCQKAEVIYIGSQKTILRWRWGLKFWRRKTTKALLKKNSPNSLLKSNCKEDQLKFFPPVLISHFIPFWHSFLPTFLLFLFFLSLFLWTKKSIETMVKNFKTNKQSL